MRNPIERSHPIEVLMAEDNDDDFVLTRICFSKVAPDIKLHRVENGVQCLAYLRRQASYADARIPGLVLVDLNMPMMDGFAVLAAIVADEQLRDVPVVILSASGSEEDILFSYRNGARSYIVKPVDMEQFVKVIRALTDYWFAIVALPDGARGGK